MSSCSVVQCFRCWLSPCLSFLQRLQHYWFLSLAVGSGHTDESHISRSCLEVEVEHTTLLKHNILNPGVAVMAPEFNASLWWAVGRTRQKTCWHAGTGTALKLAVVTMETVWRSLACVGVIAMVTAGVGVSISAQEGQGNGWRIIYILLTKVSGHYFKSNWKFIVVFTNFSIIQCKSVIRLKLYHLL